ncbi:helix-turn-helix domain-containing protein [Streptomyces fractus]|uniref:helix-turn-helix domain-containing protein n=1 Tax=Streptomyces fractus TaxID=641806 RepID=UPI003CF53599
MSQGYAYSWTGTWSALALMFDMDRLAIPGDTVRASVPLLQYSPIGALLTDHIRGLRRIADQLEGGAETEALANATMELTRAWILSVAGDDRIRRQVARETLLTRVLTYVRAHLREPDLTPQRIAWAHNTSVRTLYRHCEEGGLSLQKWIIRRRLEGTRDDLAAATHRHRAIESIARSWRFTSPAYFSRRFGQTYGLTPSEWRRSNHGGTSRGKAS